MSSPHKFCFYLDWYKFNFQVIEEIRNCKWKNKKTRKINNNLNVNDEFRMQMCWGLTYQNYLWCNANNFSLSGVIPGFYPHLLWYFIFGSLHEKPNLCIFPPKFLCKDKIVNCIKNKDAWNKLNKHYSIPRHYFI